MGLTASQMVQRITDRTSVSNLRKILGELNSAKDWAFNELFKIENGPDQLISYGTELTLNAVTREYDLGANVSGTIYGIKALWVKFSQDSVFTPTVPVDSQNRSFIFGDEWLASDTTDVAQGSPIYYDPENFAKVRFSPQLPSGTKIRVDYWKKAPDIDSITHDTLAYGSDIPEPLYEAILDKATSQCFVNIDDDRVSYWEGQANTKLRSGLYVVQKRAQGPTRTTPYRFRSRRFF
jgi:hypothetical protein